MTANFGTEECKVAINQWNREQSIVAFNLYCKIPFKKVTSTHPEIIRIANIIGRSVNSVKMKIGNFGSFDEELKKRGIVGLSNASKLDREIWNEFNNNWEKLAFESEKLIADFEGKKIEEFFLDEKEEIKIYGEDKIRMVKTRVNQNFFRQTILSAYNNSCCITNMKIPSLLIASHIVPWSKDTENRLNPHNGLCLNSLHDKAYDIGLISVTPDFEIKISNNIKKYENEFIINEFFLKYENKRIFLPERFVPKKEFLEFHFKNIFQK